MHCTSVHQHAIGFQPEHVLHTLPNRAPKPRAILKKSQVITIFQLKHNLLSATKVARSYGVSEKAVRDIWTSRTWATETWHLDPSRALKIKQSGRPLGSRDSKPRKPRQALVGGCDHTSVILKCAESDGDHLSESCSQDAGLCEGRRTYIGRLDLEHRDQIHGHPVGRPGSDAFLCSKQQCFVRMKSLDEQLFDWERGQHGTCLSDPFKADWSQLRAVSSGAACRGAEPTAEKAEIVLPCI
jgi:hypothetical protein